MTTMDKDSKTSLATKIHLSEALKQLMENRKFSKITVSDLVKTAGVNRKTFYYHFHSTSELLAWTFGREAFSKLSSYDFPTDYEVALNFAMDYLENNRRLIKSATDSIGRNEVRRFLYDDLHKVILQQVKYSLPDEPEDFQEFASEFYSEAMAGMLLRWVDDPEEYDRNKLVAHFRHLVRYYLQNPQSR